MIRLLLLLTLMNVSCSECYTGYFSNVTKYDIKGDYVYTPKGIRVYLNGNDVDVGLIDTKVDELEFCLGEKIHRECFYVYIPKDWYTSPCSGEQVIPSTVDAQLCRDKGIDIPIECELVDYPTEECPCPCNVRATIQDDKVVVTTPNLKLFKMPLARIVVYPLYIMDSTAITDCIW